MKQSVFARVMTGALLAASCPLALAHAYPTHQTPGAGATVSPSPQSVTIDFDDGLEPAFSSIAVTDAQGKAVTNGKAVVDLSNKKRMAVKLDPLAPGGYTVTWVAVANDGHRTQGHYTFTVK